MKPEDIPQDVMQVEPSPFAEPVGSTRKALQQAEAGKPRYFDAQLHARVQKLHNRGIWTFLGEKFPGLDIRLRPTFAHAVVVKRENTEQAIRIQLGLADDDPIPADKNIEINRAAVTMAITAAHGLVNISTATLDADDPDTPELRDAFEKMLAIAEGGKGKLAAMEVIREGDLILVKLTGRDRTDRQRTKEDPDGKESEHTREFFAPLLAVSMPFLTTLVRQTRGLQKVKDEDLGRLGEAFVFGQHVKDGWAD